MRLNHKQGAAAEECGAGIPAGQRLLAVGAELALCYGEIDLIVKNGGTIVFVEVKYRKNRGSVVPHTASRHPNY